MYEILNTSLVLGLRLCSEIKLSRNFLKSFLRGARIEGTLTKSNANITLIFYLKLHGI
jgi:hypothetical protein